MHHPKFIHKILAPPLHLILRITHHHTMFFLACGWKGHMYTSGQALGTFISLQITDRTAYMIESEANTSACEQGEVLKRKRPNLSMDRRAWWGVLSHFWEASGSWWSGTTKNNLTDRFCFLLLFFKERVHSDCDCHCAFSREWEKER